MHYIKIGHLVKLVVKTISRQHITRVAATLMLAVAAISYLAQLAVQLAATALEGTGWG